MLLEKMVTLRTSPVFRMECLGTYFVFANNM